MRSIHPPIQIRDVVAIHKFIDKSLPLNSTTDNDVIFNTIFKPTLYHVDDDTISRYSYAEMVALKNLPTFFTCLYIMGKQANIRTPRVIRNLIVEKCLEGNKPLHELYTNFKKISDEDIVHFKTYCHYVESSIRFALKMALPRLDYKKVNHLPHYKKFTQKYEALKK